MTFSVIFWMASDGLPQASGLFVEIVLEFLLLSEILMRLSYRIGIRSLFENLRTYHCNPNDSITWLVVCLIASIPQNTIYSALARFDLLDAENQGLTFLLAFKLIRAIPEIKRYITKLEEHMFYGNTKALIFMKCVENVGIIIFITHIASSVFLLIDKLSDHEPENVPSYVEYNPYGNGK
jgi:hypothetical protein